MSKEIQPDGNGTMLYDGDRVWTFGLMGEKHYGIIRIPENINERIYVEYDDGEFIVLDFTQIFKA